MGELGVGGGNFIDPLYGKYSGLSWVGFHFPKIRSLEPKKNNNKKTPIENYLFGAHGVKALRSINTEGDGRSTESPARPMGMGLIASHLPAGQAAITVDGLTTSASASDHSLACSLSSSPPAPASTATTRSLIPLT